MERAATATGDVVRESITELPHSPFSSPRPFVTAQQLWSVESSPACPPLHPSPPPTCFCASPSSSFVDGGERFWRHSSRRPRSSSSPSSTCWTAFSVSFTGLPMLSSRRTPSHATVGTARAEEEKKRAFRRLCTRGGTSLGRWVCLELGGEWREGKGRARRSRRGGRTAAARRAFPGWRREWRGFISSRRSHLKPYFCSTKEKASHDVLSRLAARRLWPPLMLGSSVMSWYEHLGRSICFIVCRHHRKWEGILKLFTRRDHHFLIVDLTKHTHHSAWHTMHNVICGAAELVEVHLEALNRSGVPVKVIHGSKDQVVPLECSYRMKSKVPRLDLQVIPGTDHSTVVLGREKDFTRNLENFWLSSAAHSQETLGNVLLK